MSKVIVIGSGLGGLSCGYILQKNGYDVTVLEQGSQAGGCLQCFYRHGAKFETGMHFIGSAGEGQTTDRILRYLNLSDNLQLSALDRDAYNTVSLMGQEFRFPNGKDEFIERMSSYFPGEKDSLAEYIRIIGKIAEASSPASLTSDRRDIALDMEYQTRSINEVLDSLFRNRMLKNVLVGDLPLYAARPDRTPFALHAFIMDFYNRSAFRIVGGSDCMAEGLIRNIENIGGRVITGRKVTAVRCNDSKATGVETENEEFFEADYIISTVHPNRLLEMLDTRLIRPAFRARILSVPQTTGVFSLYLKFKDRAVPYMNTNYFGYSGDSPWNCETYSEQEWPKSFLYMHMCHEQKPEWARSGVALAYMNFDEVSQWKGLPAGRRGKDYEEFKKRHAVRLIGEIEKHIPGFGDSIDSFSTSTPLTYFDYTGTEGGSLYGMAKDVTLGPAGHVPYRTRIPNLFLAGQNVNSHGFLGVMVGTVLTCSELVSPELIHKQIFR